jgi:predicted MFS family arabinose efflux permease
MGLIAAGSSASAVIFYPVNTWLIVTLGWRVALLVFGLVVVLVTVPLAALLYRDPPAVDGRHGAGAGPAIPAAGPLPASVEDWTLAAALRSYQFWAVFAMWALGVIGYQIVTTHQVAHAAERGFDAITLGWVFALGGACTVVGNLLGGALSDRWGSGWVFAMGSGIGVAGIGCLAALRGPEDLPILLLYAVSGVGFGMRIALLAAIPAELFAGRNLGVILGVANGGGGLGGFIGPFLGGWLFDLTGSYDLAFTVAGLAIAGAAVAAWVAAPRRPRPARSATR